jgi:hypothetical protein
MSWIHPVRVLEELFGFGQLVSTQLRTRKSLQHPISPRTEGSGIFEMDFCIAPLILAGID